MRQARLFLICIFLQRFSSILHKHFVFVELSSENAPKLKCTLKMVFECQLDLYHMRQNSSSNTAPTCMPTLPLPAYGMRSALTRSFNVVSIGGI